MRKRLARWLRRLARWLESPVPTNAIQEAAVLLVQKAEELGNEAADGVSGEYKRHIVYAELQKRFPKVKRRNLSIILESAVQLVKGEE